MDAEEMRTLVRNSAERPSELCMADGVKYKLTHPDFGMVTSGSILLASGPGHDFGRSFIIIPFEQILRVEIYEKRKAEL